MAFVVSYVIPSLVIAVAVASIELPTHPIVVLAIKPVNQASRVLMAFVLKAVMRLRPSVMAFV